MLCGSAHRRHLNTVTSHGSRRPGWGEGRWVHAGQLCKVKAWGDLVPSRAEVLALMELHPRRGRDPLKTVTHRSWGDRPVPCTGQRGLAPPGPPAPEADGGENTGLGHLAAALLPALCRQRAPQPPWTPLSSYPSLRPDPGPL